MTVLRLDMLCTSSALTPKSAVVLCKRRRKKQRARSETAAQPAAAAAAAAPRRTEFAVAGSGEQNVACFDVAMDGVTHFVQVSKSSQTPDQGMGRTR